MKKTIIAMGTLSLLALTACTDNNTAGNAIEPNAIAEATIDFQKIYTFSTGATASSLIQDIVSVDTYEEENAASASCEAAEQKLTGVTRIQDGLITRAYSGRNLRVDVDNMVYMLKKTCAYTFDAANASIDSLITTADGFDFACVTTTDIMNIDEALFTFNDVMAVQCKVLKNKVKQDSQDSANAVNTPAAILLPREDPDTISIDTSSRTLSAYAAQFARPEDLSFDSHVVAYNGSIPLLEESTEQETISYANGQIRLISRDNIAKFYPLTDSIIDFSKRNISCKYYEVGASDYTQPTAHILTKVTRDTIETISIYRGYNNDKTLLPCMVTNSISFVTFLIEDCEGIINENTVVSRRYAESGRWICGTSNEYKVRAYGEWYNDSLLEN